MRPPRVFLQGKTTWKPKPGRVTSLRRLAGVALLAGSFVLAALVIRYQPMVETIIRQIGPPAYPLAVIVFAIVAAAPFSVTDALAIMNGALFGPVWGSVVNAVGLVIASVLGYWLNRQAGDLLDLDAMLARLPEWVKRLRVGSPQFLIAVRIIPGFGGTMATATAAALRVPIWIHTLTMCVVAVPICTVLAIFGDRAVAVVHAYEVRAKAAVRRTELRAKHYLERHHLKIRLPLHTVQPRPEPSAP
jgi:uncharacterized membrane protein YdjX (TVP38/TMEM64 family)